MPGRYDGWFGKAGDVDASPALRDAANKLLGNLQNDNRFAPLPYRYNRAVMPDGSVIEAILFHGVGKVRILAAKKQPGREFKLQSLAGLVVQPRTFAAADAFGEHPEAILAPKNGAWSNALYDSTYLGVGATASSYYKLTKNGTDLFVGGLPSPEYSGWIDWRNANESVALCWRSSLSRYFPNGANDDEAGEGIIYYNGRALLNIHSDLPDPQTGNRYIGGAALHGNKLLLAVIDQADFGELADYFFRFYVVTIAADLSTWPGFNVIRGKIADTFCPGLILGDDAERVLEIAIPTQNGYHPARFFFNQSANECRAIVHDFDFYSGAGNDALLIREFVVDWRAYLADSGEDVTYTDTELAHLQLKGNTDYVYDEVRANVVNGTYADTSTFIYEKPYQQLVSGGIAGVLPLVGSATITEVYVDDEGDPIDWAPLAVDYQDDTPVYLYFQPQIVARETTFNGSATAQYTLDAPPSDKPETMTADAAMTTAVDWAGSRGFGLKAIDKDANIWLEVTCAYGATLALEGTSSLAGVQNPGVVPATGTAAVERTREETENEELLAVHFLDLRTRSAAYTKISMVRTLTEEITQTGNPGMGGFNYDITIDSTEHFEYGGDTRVLFFGVEQAVYSGSYIPADTVISSSFTDSSVYLLTDLRELGWPVVALTGPDVLPLFNDGWLAGHVGGPPYEDFDTPITDYPPSSDEGFTAPQGAYYWQFRATQLEAACGGTWPWTHNAPAKSVLVGAWNTYRTGWVYSMADLSADLDDAKWANHISGTIDDLDSFTGKHGLESAGQIWPISTFLCGINA